MTTTALFIERDPTYVVIVRKLRGTMTREEWDHPGHRQAAIDAAWKKALTHIRQSDPTADFVAPCPVTLYRNPKNGAVVIADISRPPATVPVWLTPGGRNVKFPPPLEHTLIRRTTYAHWAEGPLWHWEPDLVQANHAFDDIEIKRLRAQNRSLRAAIDKAIGPPETPQMARTLDLETDLVDFRIRGAFRVQDYRVLESKQSESGKLKTADGVIDLGGDGVAA